MKYIQFSYSLFPLLYICKKYSIPSDISFIIYNFIIHKSAQLIINSWFNYIMIHNINLCHIINTLPLYIHYDYFGMPFYYYNLYDKKVGIAFNICYKYINLNISDIEWWINRINYAFNALTFHHNTNNIDFIVNYNAVSNFYNKIYTQI